MVSRIRQRGRWFISCALLLLSVLPASAQSGITDAEATRFLEQCTFGPVKTDVDRVKQIGYSAFVNEQFGKPNSNYTFINTTNGLAGMRQRFYRNAVRQSDQLRQRVAFALSQVVVSSGEDPDVDSSQRIAATTAYQHLLLKHAFGNYRALLYEMTLNPLMGVFLDMANNRKPDPKTNSLPNENYARELLQLFSLGVNELNRDGTIKRDINGDPIPTYGNEEVTEFARVFTGWTFAPRPGKTFNGFQPENFNAPMALWAPLHDVGEKRLLRGWVLPAIQPGIPTNTNNTALILYASNELNYAIDSIFNHPNIAPFVATRLIQHLVTASPTPAYVDRVAAAFENNGAGVRGDMKTVIRAVLLDSEARGTAVAQATPGYGHWRSGVLFITSLLRQLDAQGDLAGMDAWSTDLKQRVFAPPSVFSYYSPFTTLPVSNGSTTVSYPAPETGTMTTESLILRINFVNALLFGTISSDLSGYTGVTGLNIPDYLAVALNTNSLVDLIAVRLMHNDITSELRTRIATAVDAIPATEANRTKRARTALYLAACSQEYQFIR
ncbi:MAG: DUF1800 domain-containing protein [Capsulimonadales bacterium]|nr:DUF1800 domain-containing protein [Capsulimonadales bacterium]